MFIFASDDTRGPTDDFWYGPVDKSLTGKRVTPQTAMKLSAFWSCAIVKAQTMAQLPLCLFRHLDRGREKARDNDLWRLVHTQPNRFQTSYQWREMGQMHLDLRGNFYCHKIINARGRIVELIPIHPDSVKVERLTATSHRFLVKDEDGQTKPYSMDEILHIAGPSLDGPVGLNPIEFHRETIGKSIATRDFGAEFYKNGATMPGWLEVPGKRDKGTRDSLQQSWQRAQTGANRFKTPVLDRGMQYHELQLKHTDMQYLESLKNEDIVISQIMRVPPYKIYRLDQAKFSNVEQMELDFVRNTMTPIARRWEQCMDSQLLDADEMDSLYFRLEFAGLLRGDTSTRGEYYTRALGAGGHHPWLTPNEVRELEERNPIDGGDELRMPENSRQPAGDTNARLTALMHANAQRCVTRLVRSARRAASIDKPIAGWSTVFFPRHEAFLGEVMQVGPAVAAAYCEDRELELLSAVDSGDDLNAVIDRWEQTGVDTLMEIASHE